MSLISKLRGLLNSSGQTKKSKPSFDEQLDVFQQLGFQLNPGVSKEDIDRWPGGRKAFEDQPFELMYITLGQSIEKEPWPPLSDACWDFDLEAIEDEDSYVNIMKNISRITKGELVFDNLDSEVEIEEGKAWVAFTCRGDSYKWNLKVNDDWADGNLFDRVQALAEKYGTKGRFTFFNTGGQDFVLGYSTPEELEKIKAATGLEIVWLKAKGQIY